MSLKLQEEYGDAINVVFVEVGNRPDTYVQQFMIQHKWMGGRSVWTREPPFETGFNYIPVGVLLSSDGKVLIRGNPIELHPKIKNAIDADIDAQRKAPKGVPDVVGKALVDFHKGNYAKALASLQVIVDKPPVKDPEGLLPAAKKAIDDFNAKIDARFARVQSLIDGGWFAEATAQLGEIAKAVKGNDELTRRQAEVLAKLQADSLKTEREAADALAKLERKLYDKGPDNATAKALEALAKKYEGTKAAERATELAEIAKEDKES